MTDSSERRRTNLTVSLSTHSQGGITENDFELASRIDPLA